MVNRSSSLLALIHQHLLQNGYAKSARELQIESGEKFTSQKVSLNEIFTHWNKEAKKRQGSKHKETPSKKLRVQDPVSPSESSDDEDNAHPKESDLVAQGKKASVKKASKVNTEIATPRKMNSAKKPASKGKGTPKIETPSVNDKPVAEMPAMPALENSSDDSDSEETTVPSKASHGQELHLKSTLAADLKSGTSSTTDSKAAQHNKNVPGKTPAAAITKPPSASNGKAVVKSCINESSESSDETDIEKQPVAVTPRITAPSIVVASKEKTETPSTQTKADSSESSESESEEPPVKPQKVPTPASSQVKAALRSAKTTAAQVKATKGKSITKDVTPASQGSAAVGKTPAKSAVDESSEESDSEDELVPSTPRPAAPSSGLALKQKVHLQPTPLKSKADDSSASTETDSEEEPVRQKMPMPEVAASQEKVDSPVNEAVTESQAKPATNDGNDASADTAVTVMTENGASLGKTQSPTEAEVSETSDSSDSEKEPENQKTTTSPKKGANYVTRAKAASAQAAKPATVVQAGAESSESSDSSDSESEVKAPEKAASNLPASNVRTSAPRASQPVATSLSAKARTPLPALADDTSETDDSESDEEPGTKKTGSQLQASNMKTPSMSAATGKTKASLQTAAPAADSSETDDSDSDEEPVATKTASQLPASNVKTPSTGVTQPMTPSQTGNAAAGKAGNLLKAPITADESSDDSDSEEDQGAKQKTASSLPASSVKTPSTAAKQPMTPSQTANVAAGKAGNLQKVPTTADDSSETDDSDSDEDQVAKKTPSSLPTSSVKTPSTAAKQPVTPSTGGKAKIALPADDSSETEDSDSDDPLTKQKTASSLPATSVKTPSTAAKQPVTRSQTPNAAAGKAGNLQKVPTTADVSSETDDSDSDEDQGTKKTPSSLPASSVKPPSTATKQPVTPSQTANAAGGKAKTALPADDSSETEDSDSDDPLTKQKTASSLPASSVKTPSTAARQPVTPSQTANAAAGKAGNLQKVPTTADDSSETEDSDSDEDQGANKTPSSLPASSVTPSQTANAVGGKAKTTLPADDSSETEDSDSDEPLTKVPTPAIAATKVKSVTKPTALTPASKSNAAAVRNVTKEVDEESSEDSDSEDEPSSAVKASGLTTGTPSVKQSAATTAHVPDSDADSESSDFSDTEQKMGLKTSASQSKTAPKLAASVGKTIGPGKRIAECKPSLAEDSSETSESEEENNAQPDVGAPKQTKPTLAAKGKLGISAASQPDKESSSEGSEADANEPVKSTPKTKVTAVTSATPSAAPLSPTKIKTPASGKVTATQKPSVDSSVTSDSSDDEIIPPAQASKRRAAKLSLQPGVAANSKAGSPAKAVTNTKPAAAKDSSGSSDSSDRKEEQAETLKKTNETALKKHNLSTPVPLLTSTPAIASPAKGKAGLPAKSPKAVKTARALVTESSESERDGEETKQVETPAPTPAKTTVKKGKGKLAKTPTPAKVETVKSTDRGKGSIAPKQVSAKESSESSESNSSDDKAAKALKSTPIVQTKLDKFFAKRTITPAKKKAITTSTASNGEEEPVEKEATATPTAPKTPQGKLSGKVGKTPKTKVTGPTKKTAGLKQMAAEGSNEYSDNEVGLALKAKVKKAAVKKQGKSLPAAKLKSSSAVELVWSEPTTDDGYSDSEEERINNSKVAYLMTTPGAYGTTDDEVSGDERSKPTAPGNSADLAEDTSLNEPEKSQDLLQAKPPIKLSSAKRKRTKEDKTTPAKERITKPSKKKAKVQTQPETKPTPPAPTTPGGLLESEEETVLALLEGRSPKKAKKKSSKKTAVVATTQDSNVIDKSSLPLDPSAWVPESPSLKGKGDKNLNSPAIPEVSQLSAKKSGKKRKSSSEDGLSKQKDKQVKKAKKEKKAKKDKKVKTADVTGDAASPKSSKKEKKKSLKDKKKLSSKKKDKEKKKQKKKEIKKLAQSLIFAESTDSGVSLQSKPKKKKVKGDKTTD